MSGGYGGDNFVAASGYKEVVERIADFKAKHPEGSLRPADLAVPYRVETIGAQTFIVYAAAAFRTPDDPAPGIGIAWEPFPGRTNFTRDSELQNAETSAWGRAIVAALASESKKVATGEDVERRNADHEARSQVNSLKFAAAQHWKRLGLSKDEGLADFSERSGGVVAADATVEELRTYVADIEHRQPEPPALIPDPDAAPSASGLKLKAAK